MHAPPQKRAHLIFHSERNPFGPKTLHEDTAERLFEKVKPKEGARFSQFVGFLCSYDATYICLPKVFRGYLLEAERSHPHSLHQDELLRPLPHLLRRCLKHYQDAHPKQSAVHMMSAYLPDRRRSELVKPISHLALAHALLHDFRAHGLWLDTTRHTRRGGRGAVHWARTIKRGGELMLEQRGGYAPVYPSPITSQRQRHADHPLTLAQLTVLSDLHALYGAILCERPLHLPPLSGSAQARSYPQLARQLKSAQRGLFQERPKRLARLLLSYLEMSDEGRRDQIDVFGTCSFEVLFETMCAEVFQSTPNLVPAHLRGQVTWRLNEALQPTIGSLIRKGATQRPDLLVGAMQTSSKSSMNEEGASTKRSGYLHYEVRGREGKELLIFDAKYYDIVGALTHHKDEEASHLPGLEDIRKQYAYAHWIRAHTPARFTKIHNALLFPVMNLTHLSSEHPPFVHLGEVSLGEPQAEPQAEPQGLRVIQLLGVDLKELMWFFIRQERYQALHFPV